MMTVLNALGVNKGLETFAMARKNRETLEEMFNVQKALGIIYISAEPLR